MYPRPEQGRLTHSSLFRPHGSLCRAQGHGSVGTYKAMETAVQAKQGLVHKSQAPQGNIQWERGLTVTWGYLHNYELVLLGFH